jgi:peptidoglycan hydrolase CwlO-like protein
MSRNKKLRKSIESIDKQIEMHMAKREEARRRGDLGLAGYFDKEIEHMKSDIENRKRKLDR